MKRETKLLVAAVVLVCVLIASCTDDSSNPANGDTPDNCTWTARTSGTLNEFFDVVWSGSQFVAVTDGGLIFTSVNGLTWSKRFNGPPDPYPDLPDSALLMAACVHNGLIVAVGKGGAIVTSFDGLTWTIRESHTSGFLKAIASSGSIVVAFGLSGMFVTSPNGVDWTTHTAESAWSEVFDAVWHDTMFVAVADRGSIMTSAAGITWHTRSSGVDRYIYCITSGPMIVAAGDNGTFLISSDGATWQSRTVSNFDVKNITWNSGRYIAVGDEGLILRSTDADDWVTCESGTTEWLSAVAASNTRVVAVGHAGLILTSP